MPKLQKRRYSTMKKGFLLILLLSSVFVQAQSLKEALFSGKLKNRPGTVVKKGDDLNAQIDTVQKADTTHNLVTNDSTNTMQAPATVDAPMNPMTARTDSLAMTAPENTDSGSASPATTDTAAPEGTNVVAEKPEAPKNNNALFKEYIDTVTSTLKTEVLPSKKIKKDTYYVTVSYIIGTDGQVEFTDVAVSPENSFLKDQIKSRLAQDAPKLAPVLSSTGTPRKVNKRQNFTLTKE
jgi:hypothetical protein